MNWQPAEQTATNPENGQRIALVNGQWVPFSQSATNPETGARVVLLEAAPRQPATLGQRVQASLPGAILQGMRDPVDAAAQLAPRALEAVTSIGGLAPNPVSRFFGGEARRVDALNTQNEQAYEAARAATGRDGFDGGRIVGNITSPVNAAAALAAPIRGGMTLGQLAGRGAVGGAVGGLLQPVNDPQAQQNFAGEKAAQAAMGAVTGGLLTPGLVRGTEAVVRRAVPLSVSARAANSAAVDQQVAEALREVGQDPSRLSATAMQALRDQALESLQQGRRLDVAAALRDADFRRLDMQPLLGQVTRDPTLYARELNLRGIEGVGDPIMQRLQGQRRQLGDSLRGFSGGSTERADAGMQIITALQGVDDRMSRNVTDLYRAARASAQADLDIPLAGLAQDVADVVDRFGDKVPSGVMNQVQNLGLLGGTQRRVFTLADADRLTKVINDNVGNDPASNAALTALRQGVRRAVTEAVPAADNPFFPAVTAARDRFALLDALPALRSAAEGGANEDRFVRQYLLQARPTEVRQLADLLGRESPGALQQARQQVGAFLERAAFGTNTAGDRGFAPERFAAALDSLGTARLSAFFSPDEIAQLRTIGRVGAYISSEPAFATVNRSNTGAAGANLVLQALRAMPGGSAGLSLGQAAISPVINSRRVSAALAAQVPQTAAELTPEQARALSRFVRPLVIGSGVAGASGIQ